MAEVYRGYHVSLDRYVAIKLLHPFLADDPEFKDRFENEARNVAKLKHPNIVQVYDFEYDAEGESYYMVMEIINGPTLKDRLFELTNTGENLPRAEAIRIGKSAAEALAYAHQRNMIHRDVKPANLMLDEDGRVVLTDFGIAKIVTGAQFTASGGMIGTPAYMAPEQGLGEAGDERSDIYSLGVILFQLLTNHLPYDADTPLGIILKHVNEPIPAPRQYASDIPDDLERIVFKALAKEPSERYQTAAELAEDLGQLDENGQRRPQYDTPAHLATTPAPPAPYETSPKPPGQLGAAEDLALPETLAEPSPAGQGTVGRLRVSWVLGLIAALAVVAGMAMLGLGTDDNPLASILGNSNSTATPVINQTGTAIAPTADQPTIPVGKPSPTPGPTQRNTPRSPAAPSQTATTNKATIPVRIPTQTLEPQVVQQTLVAARITQTPRATTPPPTLTPSAEPSDTATPEPSLTPTPTRTPPPTPSPNMTATNGALTATVFFATQAAKSPTPNMTQTLEACDFEYIVVAPENTEYLFNEPPPSNAFNSPRLIPAGEDFTLDIVLRNTGNCDWPERVRFNFNPDLTENPDSTVNLAPYREACTESEQRPGLNFAAQQQSNFYLGGPVDVMDTSDPLEFTGTAPNRNGCYYSVWDALYPNSNVPIGRPFVLTIRVWGGS